MPRPERDQGELRKGRNNVARLLSLSALLVSSAVACASTSSLLVKRFSREHGCEPDQVRVFEHGGNGYIAEGCGQRAEYVCSTFAGSEGSVNDCQERNAYRRASPEPSQRLKTGTQEPPR